MDNRERVHWQSPEIRNVVNPNEEPAPNLSDGATGNINSSQIPDTEVGTSLGTQNVSLSPPNPALSMVAPSSIIFRSPYYINPPFPDAGLTLSQAQAINEKWFRKTLDNQFLYQKKCIELDKHYREKLLNQNFANKANGIQSNMGMSNNVPIPSKFDLNEFGISFMRERAIVKIRDRHQDDGILYMVRSEEYNRHVPMNASELSKEYDFHLFDYDIQKRDRDHAFRLFCKRIPFLTQSSLNKLEDYQVMFKNGYYDLHEKTFIAISINDRVKYYNEFSLEFDYVEEEKEPIIFEKMLSDMFEADTRKINLAYQYIGAFLTPISTLKKIFVFQGKSNGGKTRLSKIIINMMPENDTEILGTTSEISSSNAKNPLLPRRLIYIREHADKKIPSMQKTNLKSASDGDSNWGRNFKILINTNYPVFTSSNGAIEPSIYTRLTVLPFPKAMDNTEEVAAFEDVYFEQEKASIARKALEAFSEVLNNNNQFDCPYEINQCVEAEDMRLDSVNTQESQYQNKKILEVIDNRFEISEEIDPTMTIETIMETVREELPDITLPTNLLGRMLNTHFGKLQSKQIDQPRVIDAENPEHAKRIQKTCYNLKRRITCKTYNG